MLTINNTTEGYLKDIEIKGNTWQDSENLADIRSVGTKVEGQELYEIPVLSVGENVFNNKWELGDISSTGEEINSNTKKRTDFIKIGGSNVITPCMPKYAKSAGARYIFMRFYDKSKKYLGGNGMGDNYIRNSYTPPVGSEYVRFTMDATITECEFEVFLDKRNFVFEGNLIESTPYQEDKLTILSPVQLEKVGDVADRIICKDGVWGIEKNIVTKLLNGSENWYGTTSRAYYWFTPSPLVMRGSCNVICDSLVTIDRGWDKHDIGKSISTHSNVDNIYINYIIDEVYNIGKLKEYLNANPITIKYPTTQPTFIPLPHDQQIKLRTFADRTNIHFETEIEGTIKAQVPKSLGATVNTHTTQIDNLNKELDRVKRLEESTVSTVTTSKAFTTIAETTQGYFEDVKIEGKTLVNLGKIKQGAFTPLTVTNIWNDIIYKVSNEVTLVFNSDKSTDLIRVTTHSDEGKYINEYVGIKQGLNTFKIKRNGLQSVCIISYSSLDVEVNVNNILILEGDHTDKDLNFFEGLKSVGQDTDEISVLSTGTNKLDTLGQGHTSKPIYAFTTDLIGEINSYIKYFNNVGSYANCNNLYDYYNLDENTMWINLGSFNREEALINLNYKIAEIEKKANKKQILYYNPTTQAWEKPVLREWDSIEKHSDGKYYYHKRSGEVVLNGSEDWTQYQESNDIGYAMFTPLKLKALQTKLMCDRFVYKLPSEIIQTRDGIGTNSSGDNIYIGFTKDKGVDISTCKQWLQANPTTVVYQLAKEEVYECTNLDLITYPNETNLIVNSGAIQPRLKLKVLSNVSNVVKLLQEKVSILENNTSSYIVTQNRLQLASTYAADSVTFKVDYASAFDNRSVDGYNPDLYNLILSNILVGKDNYDFDKMFSIILDYASWDQISWEQFDELVLLMDIQHNPPIEIPEEDYTEEEIPEI